MPVVCLVQNEGKDEAEFVEVRSKSVRSDRLDNPNRRSVDVAGIEIGQVASEAESSGCKEVEERTEFAVER